MAGIDGSDLCIFQSAFNEIRWRENHKIQLEVNDSEPVHSASVMTGLEGFKMM